MGFILDLFYFLFCHILFVTPVNAKGVTIESTQTALRTIHGPLREVSTIECTFMYCTTVSTIDGKLTAVSTVQLNAHLYTVPQ